MDINEAGKMSASYYPPGEDLPVLVRFSADGTPEYLSQPNDLGRIQNTTINIHGQIVITDDYSMYRPQQAYRYTDGVGFKALGFLGRGGYSYAEDMNDLGHVVEQSNSAAFLYTDAAGMVGLASSSSYATGITNSGVIYGTARDD